MSNSTYQTPKPEKKKGGRTIRRKKQIVDASYEEATKEEDSKDVRRTDKQKKTTRKERKELNPDIEKAIDMFVNMTTDTGVEGFRKMFKENLQGYMPPPELYKFTAFEANPTRNRYADVVCLDESRVKLTMDVPPSTDYIHANWIRYDRHDRAYIATQGPLENTIEDFWRMVFQETCSTIVNLTKTIEDGKNKCAQYWPLESGSYQTYGKMFVSNKKVEQEEKFDIYTLEVLPDGCSNSIIVKMIHVNFWPDRGIPMSGLTVLRLIRVITTCDKLAVGPVVVHCSAGIGRSGTIVFIDILLQKLFKQATTVDLTEIFKHLRNQRASMVQQEGQFVFVILSILDYVKARLPKYTDKVQKFKDDFKASNLAA